MGINRVDRNQFLVQNKNKTGSNRVMNTLDALRMQVRLLEGHHLETPGSGRVLPFADGRLNAPFPGGGLQLGALHEFRPDGMEAELAPAVTAFTATVAAGILKSREGFMLWASSRADCYPPGLRRFGLDPARIVWIDCRKDAEVLGVMEEALHSQALAAVLGEAGALSLKTARRLDAAARQSGATALLLRRPLSKPSQASAGPSGAAATRWRVSAIPHRHPGNGNEGPTASRHPGTAFLPCPGSFQTTALVFVTIPDNACGVSGMTPGGIGPPRWRLDLEYCRNGRTASWIVEALHGADGEDMQAGYVRVVAELRDDAREGEAASARRPARTARAS
jgi:hypothetical protein